MKWAIGLSVLLGGGLALGSWWRRRWLIDASLHAETLIRPAQIRFVGQDDQLRVRTELRRDAAARLKTRARKIESGESISVILRAVK